MDAPGLDLWSMSEEKYLMLAVLKTHAQTLILYTLTKQTRRKLTQPPEPQGGIRGTGPEG